MRRSLITYLAVVVSLLMPGYSALAQTGAQPADKSANHESSSSSRASMEEVQQLRSELALQQRTMESQQKTIEELKAMVSDLARRVGTTDAHVLPAAATQGAHLKTLGYSSSTDVPSAEASLGQTPLETQKAPEKKKEPEKLEFSVAGGKVQFYGHADVSYDYVDNGISPALEATNALLTTPGLVARGNNGWLGQISSNLSYFGVRGSHKITPYLTGIFQFETEIGYSATPGPTSDLQCRGCLGSRDSYVGLQGEWGAVKIGKEDAPYKRTTVPLDPFYNTLGDARSIMGNSGGDNRAEFMGRISNAIWYESPTSHGLNASILFSPGQNRSSDNGAYGRGAPNCNGGNGAFTLSFQNSPNVAEGADFNSLLASPDINPCNDGSWGNVLSTALTYKAHGLYAFGAYEHHGAVNRTTDLVGVADEAAWKFGISYTAKPTGTTGSFIYEKLKRYAADGISGAIGQPILDPRLDERSRPLATMAVLTQKLSKFDSVSVDWIHAGNSRGDPGFCAPEAPGNCAPGQDPATAPFNVVNNKSNMYAAGFKHTITKNMSTYFVYARQANHTDAHYDLGAVGHGVVVDKRDFTGHGFPGTRLQGISGGMTFDF